MRESQKKNVSCQPANKPGSTAIFWLCLIFWPWLLAGQTNNPTLTYPANRYLLVVETSHAMQRRADAMAQSVRDLLGSALATQARHGDTLGVWTFNEEVYTRLLPLQQLAAENQKSVNDRVVSFLKAQKFEKHARLDKLVPALSRVVRASAFITIVLVCTGDEEIHGTPFDQRINDFFRTWHQQQLDAGTPFVIALRAQKGQFVDCSMNPSPWPAELPALPKELFVPLPTPHPLAMEPRKPVSSVPPLIISGKKRETSASIKSPETVVPTNPAFFSATNLAAPAQPEPTIVRSAENSEKTSPAFPGQTGVKTDAVSTYAPPSAGNAKPVSSSLVTESQPAGQTSGGAPAVEQHVATPTDLPPAAPALTKSGNEPSSPARKSFSTSPAVEVATSVPPRPGLYPTILFGIALTSLAAAAVAGVWIWRRRSRPVREVSLITESIDRRKN
jgi:hypothetical protein